MNKVSQLTQFYSIIPKELCDKLGA